MGIYSGDEIEETQLPKDVSPNVIERISNGTKGTEGFTADHAHAELDQIAPASGGAKIKPKKKAAVIVEAEPVKEPVAAKPAKAEKPAPTAKAAAAKAEPAKPAASAHAPPLDRSKQPKTVVQWQKYAVEWINAETDADEIKNRWAAERSMRNGIGVTADDREGVETIRDARIQDLSK
jgi:hypothetical protein